MDGEKGIQEEKMGYILEIIGSENVKIHHYSDFPFIELWLLDLLRDSSLDS